MYPQSFSGTFLKVVSLALMLSAGLAAAEKTPKANPDPKPQINITFEDDASSLIILADWTEEGKLKQERFGLGKDIFISYTKQGREWVKDSDFRSKNWEAYLFPDLTGFVLMEREYDGKRFENVTLRMYSYYPKRRVISLRPANGSPYWSIDGKQFAVVENLKEGVSNLVMYDVEAGKVLFAKSRLSDNTVKELTEGYVRARVCDDEVPCESAPVKNKNKWMKLFKLEK